MSISSEVLNEIHASASEVLSILEDLDETPALNMAEEYASVLSEVEELDKESAAYALDRIGYSMMKALTEATAGSPDERMFLLFTMALQVIAYHLLDE